ncbi:hypothetical protein D3C72_2047150 [compost metagenome]
MQQIHTRLLEREAVALASKLDAHGHPISVGHVVVGPGDRKRPFRYGHHLAQHLAHGGQATVRARELVVARLVPNHVGRDDAAEGGLVAGLCGLDVGFGDFNGVHGDSLVVWGQRPLWRCEVIVGQSKPPQAV